MTQTIGIPRALYYYQYHIFWETLFQNLGVEVVLSEPTNKRIVDWGIKNAVDGCCLPLKVYLGHIQSLVEQDVRSIFVPQIISVAKKEYICPYSLGLPDLVANLVPEDVELITPVIDCRRFKMGEMRGYINMGRQFASLPDVWRAYKKAETAYKIWKLQNEKPIGQTTELQILILGHEYLLDDPYISFGIKQKLAQAGVTIVTQSNLPHNMLLNRSQGFPKRMFWTSGRKSLSALESMFPTIDGVLILTAFSCGTDSFISDLISRNCYRTHIPNLLLNLDEHTGEAGLITRIEAFLDMLIRRKGA